MHIYGLFLLYLQRADTIFIFVGHLIKHEVLLTLGNGNAGNFMVIQRQVWSCYIGGEH